MTAKRTLMAMLTGSFIAMSALTAQAAEKLIITLKDNNEVTIDLRDDLAPKHVAQVVELARSGAYDNVAFHRVIDKFMAQTGDVQCGDMEDGFNPARVGTGGSDLPDIEAEFTREASFDRGVVGMARSQDPNSANSQFFIMFEPAPHLDGLSTIIGEVTSGMEHVDVIKRGAPEANGAVIEPDRMISVRVE